MEHKPIEIPGYFYDEKAKRYFKHTQGFREPDDNRFTMASVKRCKTEEKELERNEERRRRANARIRRSKILDHPATGGHLARELFGPVSQATASLGSCDMASLDFATSSLWTPSLSTAPMPHCARPYVHRDKAVGGDVIAGLNRQHPGHSANRPLQQIPNSHLTVRGMSTMGRRPAVERDMRVACWVDEFEEMGRLDMVPGAVKKKTMPNVPVFMVGGYDYKMGMGTVYATMDRNDLYGAYLPFDESNRLNFSEDLNLTAAVEPGTVLLNEPIRCPHISSITYHEPSNRVLLTSRKAEPKTTLYIFNPLQSLPADDKPLWLLGETDFYRTASLYGRPGDSEHWWSNCAAIAPASSSLVAAIGTNVGITTFTQSEAVTWLTPPGGDDGDANMGEVRSIDFMPGNSEVLLAGGRRGHVLLADMRLPASRFEYSALVHTDAAVRLARLPETKRAKDNKTQIRLARQATASIAHVRSLNEYQVLVAGIRDAMAVYDLRWHKSSWMHAASLPITSFAGYRNSVHLDIGLALSADRKALAAAHDDGTVAVYSTLSGRRLRCPPVDDVRGSQNTPVRCLQWATMPRERGESLWIGAGPTVLGVGMCRPLGGGDED